MFHDNSSTDKAYADEPATTIIVRDGKLRYSTRTSSLENLILTGRQMEVLNPNGGLNTLDVYLYRHFGSRSKKLVFGNQQISESCCGAIKMVRDKGSPGRQAQRSALSISACQQCH
jgi:hypothetical protein